MSGPWHAWVQRNWGPGHRLFLSRSDLSRRGPGGHGCVVSIVNGFTFTETEEGLGADPLEGIGNAGEIVQAILDAAWEAGFRPRGFSDVKNETTALRGHLEDMRALAFNSAGVARP